MARTAPRANVRRKYMDGKPPAATLPETFIVELLGFGQLLDTTDSIVKPFRVLMIVADVRAIPKTQRMAVVRGEIDRAPSSLVAAVDAAGETIDLTLALAEIFGGEIDFSTELQPGDRFELSVEKEYREDEQFAGYG